jgi:hypothetical protein
MEQTWHGLTPGRSTEDDVRTALGEPEDVQDDVTHKELKGLRLLDYDKPPSTILLKEGRVWLIGVVPDDSGEFPREKAVWQERFGPPQRKLKSTLCKNCWIHLYADRGMAGTFEGDRLQAVQLFAPTDPETYERTIYIKPPRFTK